MNHVVSRSSSNLFMRFVPVPLLVPALLSGALCGVVHAQGVSFAGVQTTLPAVGLAFPEGVALDRAGDVFIADTFNSRIVELPAGGGVQIVVPTNSLYNPTGVAVDGAGDVFVADYDNNRVVEVPGGTGTQVTVGGSMVTPFAVSVDAAGDLFVADSGQNQVLELPVGGNLNAIQSFTGLSNPEGVAVDPAGDLFVTNYNLDTVLELPAGSSTQVTLPTVSLQGPTGLAVDRGGDVFVADYFDERVVELPAGTGTQVTLSTTGLGQPTGVTVDGAGDVFIADPDNNRVIELQTVSVNFGTANVCPGAQAAPAPCSTQLTLTYNVTATGTFGTTKVSTQGAPNLDFTGAGSSTCTGQLTAPTTCTVTVTFAPKLPGPRAGAVQILSGTGAVLATTLLHGVGEGPAIGYYSPGSEIQLSTSGMNTVLAGPAGVAVDGAGDVFLVDQGGGSILELPVGGGAPTVVAAGLNGPTAVAVDGAGDLFVAELSAGQVLELPAGGGTPFAVLGNLAEPQALAVDGAGDLFIGLAGGGPILEYPAGCAKPACQQSLGSGFGGSASLAVDAAGDVFVADAPNGRVVEVPAGCATANCQITVASGLGYVAGVAVDAAGDVFVAANPNLQLLEFPAGGAPSFPVSSGLIQPYAVALDGAGDIFVTDFTTSSVYELPRAKPPGLNFATTVVGNLSSDSPQTVTIQNVGNQALNAVSPGIVVTGPSFAQATGASGDCTAAFALAPGGLCNVRIDFTPQGTGTLTSTAVLTDNALNNGAPASQTIGLSGAGQSAQLQPQTITFAAIPSQTVGIPLQLAATASSGLTVSFATTTTKVCAVAASTATFIAPGNCTITASQSGDAQYAAAQPVSRTFTVNAAVAGKFTVNPSALVFPNQQIGTSSASTSITVTNTGGTPLTIASVATVGSDSSQFTQTNNCSAPIAVAGNCVIQVTFSPTLTGALTSHINVTAAASPTVRVALSGTGVAPSFSLAKSLNFGSLGVTLSSAAQAVTISNTGIGPLAVTALNIKGTNPHDFTQTANCSTPIPSGGNCTVNVVFAPTGAGARSAMLNVQGAGRTWLHLALSGTGIAPSFTVSPSPLSFGDVPTNTSSAVQTLTVQNTGPQPLPITDIVKAGTNPGDFAQTNNCGGSVPVAGSCTISIVFKPLVRGALTAEICVHGSHGAPTLTTVISGTGT